MGDKKNKIRRTWAGKCRRARAFGRKGLEVVKERYGQYPAQLTNFHKACAAKRRKDAQRLYRSAAGSEVRYRVPRVHDAVRLMHNFPTCPVVTAAFLHPMVCTCLAEANWGHRWPRSGRYPDRGRVR